MAVRRTYVTSCDSCGVEKDTTRVRIDVGDKKLRQVDLCEKCIVPLHKLMGVVDAHRPPRSGAEVPVVSMDDILAATDPPARRRGARRAPGTPLSRDNSATPDTDTGSSVAPRRSRRGEVGHE